MLLGSFETPGVAPSRQGQVGRAGEQGRSCRIHSGGFQAQREGRPRGSPKLVPGRRPWPPALQEAQLTCLSAAEPGLSQGRIGWWRRPPARTPHGKQEATPARVLAEFNSRKSLHLHKESWRPARPTSQCRGALARTGSQAWHGWLPSGPPALDRAPSAP